METSSLNSELCRACMKKETGMKCIFNSEVNSVPVSQMLSFATPLMIRPDDGLPNTLCANCLQILISFYKFQQMCIESDQKFRVKPRDLPKKTSFIGNNQTVVKYQPPPPPPDDYMTKEGKVMDWNSCEPVPVFEVSDDEDVVLKFECDNDLYVATEEDDGISDPIDEYAQFDKLPIIDVRIDEKPRKGTRGTSKSSDEEVVLFTINADIPSVQRFECRICRCVFDRQDSLDKHLRTHFLPKIKPVTNNLPSSSTSKPLIKGCPIKLAYICNICKMAFGGQDRLAMHKKTHDKQGLSRNELTLQDKSSYSFECKTCEKFYNNHESFERHPCVPDMHCNNGSMSKDASFEDQRLYTCNICKKAFQTWEELTKHISDHQIKILYGSDPGSNTTVNVNVNIQTDKTHECEICKKTFSSWDEFKTHWQQHPENQRGNVTTQSSEIVMVSSSTEVKEAINLTSDSEDPLKPDIKISAEDTVKVCSQHVCNLCGKVFNSFVNLKRHMKLKHKRKHNSEENEMEELNPVDALRAYRILRLYECGICGKTFDRQGHLLRHKKTHRKKMSMLRERLQNVEKEPDTDKPYQCDVCGIFVCSGQNLRRHMKRIHEIDEVKQEKKRKGFSNTEEIFACIVCDEELISRRALVQHLAKHKKEKEKDIENSKVAENEKQTEEKVEEEEVKENDETKDDNRRITRGKASIDKDKPYECSCGRRFKNVGHRDQHMLIHELQAETDQTETKCKYCQRECKTSHHLLQHMITHKMFKCPTCGEGFARSENLIRHKKTHNSTSSTSISAHVKKNELLRCNVCRNKFKSKSSKIRHMRNVHGVHVVYPTEPKEQILYKCVHCKKSFSKIDNLKDHKKCHSNSKKEKKEEEKPTSACTILPTTDPHRCLECRIVVSTRGCLRKHMYRKHKNLFYPTNKKYTAQCACTKPFDTQGNLMKHIRAHIVKPNSGNNYACHFCFIDRPHAWQIRRHLKDSHAVTAEELKAITWKVCKACNTNYINTKELRRHIKANHGKKDKVLTKTVYKCQSCDKCFLKKELMLQHVITHKTTEEDGEEEESANFIEETWPTCKICNKAFAKAYRIRRHMQTVHNLKVKEEDITSANPEENVI